MEVTIEKKSISVPMAAKMIGISSRFTWDLVKEGKLRSFRLGSRVLIRVTDLDAFLAEATGE
jgi:excisionase family DNA binding protein